MKIGLNLFSGHILELLNQFKGDYTSEGSEEIAITALNVGANDYISKKQGFYKQIPDQIQYTLKHAYKKPEHLSVLYAERNQDDIDLGLRYFKKHAPNFHFSIVSTGEEILNLLPENNGITSSFCGVDFI